MENTTEYRAPIVSKRQMYALQEAGLLGSHHKAVSCREFYDLLGKNAISPGPYMIRRLVPGAKTRVFNVPPDIPFPSEADPFSDEMFAAHCDDLVGGSDWDGRVSAVIEPALSVFQAEVTRSERGLMVTWSTQRAYFREAMLNPATSTGLLASMVLKHYLCPNSLADVEELLDLYPGHVIEIGVYQGAVGSIPNRNAIIWEVRSY